MEGRHDTRYTSTERDPSQEVKRLVAYRQIQNLMGRRAYFHDANRNDLELTLYANRNDISWGQNHGFWIGLSSIRRYYVEWGQVQGTRHLSMINAHYPQIENELRNLASGSFLMHMLTTPVIEIAGDFKTAKAMWYTPSLVIGFGGEEVFMASWLWEQYAADFIFEENEWKFWHLNVFTDFMTPFPQSPADAIRLRSSLDDAMSQQAISAGTEGVFGPTPEDDEAIPSPELITQTCELWWQGWVPQLKPRPPVPYHTFDETFSYEPGGTGFIGSK